MMNARFVQQVTAALAPDRLEAYRQDGAPDNLALALCSPPRRLM